MHSFIFCIHASFIISISVSFHVMAAFFKFLRKLTTSKSVIALITEWRDADGSIKVRDEKSDMGGTMRLGAQSSDVAKGTLAHSIYGDVVTERHRHRYEYNDAYRAKLEAAGLRVGGTNPQSGLVEIVEVKDHPWMVGVQYHPEFKSRPDRAHPLFAAFVKAAVEKSRLSC